MRLVGPEIPKQVAIPHHLCVGAVVVVSLEAGCRLATLVLSLIVGFDDGTREGRQIRGRLPVQDGGLASALGPHLLPLCELLIQL